MRYAWLLVVGSTLLSTSAQALPRWESRGVVAPGRQFAALAEDDRVHIISERYVQIDVDGASLVDEA
ncbi:MAG: hypothetical protein K0V04_11925, partial [Deltaproteobacteria bacterium]|nr:hypothetical protein [Deltaproteobacteria bacterium]